MSAVGERKTVAPVFDEICEQTGVTLSRYMMEVARQNPELRDLESLMGGIQQACKTIANLVDRATITGMVGYEASGNINIQGEEQKKLDVITNDVLKRALAFTGKVGVIASEEEDVPVFNSDAYRGPRVPGGEGKYQDVMVDVGSKYVTVFDPLDGSSNVDANIPTGTIFGVYEEMESLENCALGTWPSSWCVKLLRRCLFCQRPCVQHLASERKAKEWTEILTFSYVSFRGSLADDGMSGPQRAHPLCQCVASRRCVVRFLSPSLPSQAHNRRKHLQAVSLVLPVPRLLLPGLV